jgi:SAM-dependent methyltransferase
MNKRSASFYDALYHFRDYPGQAGQIHDLVQAHCPGASTLLDVGCGTGKHIESLCERYTTEGLDLNEDLLRIARERCPGVSLHLADMTEFDLGKKFDVVTCLFSAIGYVRTHERLKQTIACMAGHLASGGIVLLEPWFSPDNYWREHVAVNVVDEPERKIVWMYNHAGGEDLSVFDIHYLVGTPAGVEHFTERHEMGLFTSGQYQDAFTGAGLTVEFDPDGLAGRGLYLATKA